MIAGDSSLLELIRSIHLTPPRAGMVQQKTDEYPWPSPHAYLGMDSGLDFFILTKADPPEKG